MSIALALIVWPAARGFGLVNLEWRPSSQTVSVGQPVDIGLYAVADSDDPEQFFGLDIILRWNPLYMGTAQISIHEPFWSFDGFPTTGYLINSDLGDGSALYEAYLFGPQVTPVTATSEGLLCATPRFTAQAATDAAELGIDLWYFEDGEYYETRVYPAGGPLENIRGLCGTAQVSILPTTIPAMKRSADFTPGSISGAIVSAAFPGFFYIETDDRACAIRVDRQNHGLIAGMRADVTGEVKTNENGERYIDASDAAQNGTGDVGPLSLNNRVLGGGDWFYNGTTGAGQKGISGTGEMCNLGLLVRTLGYVIEVDPGGTWFRIDDGSRNTPPLKPPVLIQPKCLLPEGVSAPPLDALVYVTGISSCEKIDGEMRRLLRVRTQDDIRVAEAPQGVGM